MGSFLSPASRVHWRSSSPKRPASGLRRPVGGDGGGTVRRLRGRARGGGGGGGGRAAWQHARAPSVRNFQPALFGEGAIRIGNRSEVDAQIGGEAPYTGQVGARWQGAFHQKGADLIDNLAINRRRSVEVDSNLRIVAHCILFINTIQLAGGRVKTKFLIFRAAARALGPARCTARPRDLPIGAFSAAEQFR